MSDGKEFNLDEIMKHPEKLLEISEERYEKVLSEIRAAKDKLTQGIVNDTTTLEEICHKLQLLNKENIKREENGEKAEFDTDSIRLMSHAVVLNGFITAAVAGFTIASIREEDEKEENMKKMINMIHSTLEKGNSSTH